MDTTGIDTTGMDTTGIDTTGIDTTRMDTTGIDTTGIDTTDIDTTGIDITGMDTTGMAISRYGGADQYIFLKENEKKNQNNYKLKCQQFFDFRSKGLTSTYWQSYRICKSWPTSCSLFHCTW
jgi:hypothetical protein